MKNFLIHRLHRLNGLKTKNPSLLICGNLCNLWIKDLFFTLTLMTLDTTPNDENAKVFTLLTGEAAN